MLLGFLLGLLIGGLAGAWIQRQSLVRFLKNTVERLAEDPDAFDQIVQEIEREKRPRRRARKRLELVAGGRNESSGDSTT